MQLPNVAFGVGERYTLLDTSFLNSFIYCSRGVFHVVPIENPVEEKEAFFQDRRGNTHFQSDQSFQRAKAAF